MMETQVVTQQEVGSGVGETVVVVVEEEMAEGVEEEMEEEVVVKEAARMGEDGNVNGVWDWYTLDFLGGKVYIMGADRRRIMAVWYTSYMIAWYESSL
jgi:hypothetical protein